MAANKQSAETLDTFDNDARSDEMTNDRGSAAATGVRAGQGRIWAMWWAALVSALGDGVLVLGLPLLAATLTDDSRLITGVFVANRISWAASPAVGAWIDRRGRPRKVMIEADQMRFVVLMVFAVLLVTASDSVALAALYPVAFLLGLGEVAFSASNWSLVRHMVPDKDLATWNSRLSLAQTGGEQLVGPILGGALFRWARLVPILGDACSFAISAFLLRSAPDTRLAPDPTRSFAATIRAGLSELRTVPALRVSTMWMAGIAALHGMQVSSLVLIGQALALTEFEYGVFLALIAAGNVLGSMVAPLVQARLGAFEVLALCAFTTGAAHVLAGVSRSALAVGTSLAIDGVAVVVATMAAIELRQRRSSPDLIASVMATIRMCIYGAGVPAGLVAGVLLRRTDVFTMLRVVGFAVLFVGFLGVRRLRVAVAN